MDLNIIVDDIQVGMIMIGLQKPLNIVISTFDLDLDLFIREFYDPSNSYNIWYWYLKDNYNLSNLPKNIKLNHLERNHCKFWYLENKYQSRLIITSANLTHLMIHECLQSFISFTSYNNANTNITVKELNRLKQSYNNTIKPFFDIFKVNLSMHLYKLVENRIIFNVPNHFNGIERWFINQSHLLIDCNNITANYLPDIKKSILIRDSIPPVYNKIVSYYNTDKANRNVKIIHIPFTKVFHYKLYYTDKCLLVSSNNFSYNHKTNFEMGIILN